MLNTGEVRVLFVAYIGFEVFSVYAAMLMHSPVGVPRLRDCLRRLILSVVFELDKADAGAFLSKVASLK